MNHRYKIISVSDRNHTQMYLQLCGIKSIFNKFIIVPSHHSCILIYTHTHNKKHEYRKYMLSIAVRTWFNQTVLPLEEILTSNIKSPSLNCTTSLLSTISFIMSPSSFRSLLIKLLYPKNWYFDAWECNFLYYKKEAFKLLSKSKYFFNLLIKMINVWELWHAISILILTCYIAITTHKTYIHLFCFIIRRQYSFNLSN